MRLEKIKLAGFKSFVDPTSILLPSNLVGIVGPNGCGKSNIIDAVRWVMGESSAKHLRGDSMSDVIFNGAASRKPVSVASVELVFDNSDKRIGGEYAHYNQLSIKRQVVRDGQSTYFLNNSRCRRKDVTDIFLGTGLGPRSYAIIEQGTISRLIEAKPNELRVFIEEAAGISRYKERRRETASSMRNTQENLERLNDLKDEVSQQLRHLQRQVKKAEQYAELKQQQRECQQQLLAMRWQRYHLALEAEEAKIETLNSELKDALVQQHKTEDDLREGRQALTAQQALASSTQEQFYQLTTEIGRIEQLLQYNQDNRQALEDDHARMIMTREQSSHHQQQDRSQLQQLATDLEDTQAALEQAEVLAGEIEQQQQDVTDETEDWQRQWEVFQTQFAQSREQTEVQRARIQQLDARQQQIQQTRQRLEQEQSELSVMDLQQETTQLQQAVESLQEQSQLLEDESQQLDRQTQEQKQQIKQFRGQLDQLRSQTQKNQGKRASLELLQKHAMGKDKTELLSWLQKMGLQDATRLAEHLEVESGWERAVETVLEAYLQAVCTEGNTAAVLEQVTELKKDTIALFNTDIIPTGEEAHTEQRLLDKVRAPWSLSSLLSSVYVADDLSEAEQIRSGLAMHESVITLEGIWLGPGWAIHRQTGGETSGVLERAQALRELKVEQQRLDEEMDLLQQQQETAEAGLAEAESRQHQLRQQSQGLNHELNTQNSLLSSQLAHLQQTEKRLKQVQSELQEIRQQQAEQAQSLNEAIGLRDDAELQLPELEQQKQDLLSTQQQLKLRSDEVSYSLDDARQSVQQFTARLETLGASRRLTEKNLQRVDQQYQEANEQIKGIKTRLAQLMSPGDDETEKLEPLQQARDQQQQALVAVKEQLKTQGQNIETRSKQQSELEASIEVLRSQLEAMRMDRQTNLVHRETLEEQLEPFEVTAVEALKIVPEGAGEVQWEAKLESLTQKIQRLGAINLVAVEEYKSQNERHQLLQQQQDDLSESLALLESAIAKIDKESQVLFKDTFERVNEGLKNRFPKLFAGGQAYLELDGQDLLESGVRIMARPPGKRNSSIHLLSGGEKALTAIALVFSIFDLNPSPFCILDEVDAPLDDANVIRFSQLVEEMSETIQFIYITHNKVTMEISKHLAGVTQKELGVSRMVSVDIDAAIELAAV